MTKCSIKYKVAICGRTKCTTNKSLLVYEQLCRKGCRECNMRNWLTPPGLFTLSLSISLSLSLPLLIAHSIEFRLTTIVQSQLCTNKMTVRELIKTEMTVG